MASVVFTIKDSPEARKELSLLLQVDPKQISRFVHDGQITLEFAALDEKALHVVSGSVANHGFTVKEPASSPAAKPQVAVDGKARSRVNNG